MKVVSVVAQKGGAGKTTLSLATACAAAYGRSAVVVDLDPQATAASWGDRRRSTAPPVLPAQPLRLPRILEAAATHGVDLALVDTAPRVEQSAVAAARATRARPAGRGHAAGPARQDRPRRPVGHGLHRPGQHGGPGRVGAGGPLFRSLRKDGTPGERLHPSQIPSIFKGMARAAGLADDVAGALAGRGARVKAAQDMIAAGIELPAILQAGRWKSAAMVGRYGERLLAGRGAAAQLARLQGRE